VTKKSPSREKNSRKNGKPRAAAPSRQSKAGRGEISPTENLTIEAVSKVTKGGKKDSAGGKGNLRRDTPSYSKKSTRKNEGG